MLFDGEGRPMMRQGMWWGESVFGFMYTVESSV